MIREELFPLDTDPMEIVDWVWDHLQAQGKRCLSPNGVNCNYRNNTPGEACAAGCLIPDKYYYLEMEGRKVSSLPFYSQTDSNLDKFINKFSCLLSALQVYHDKHFHYQDTKDDLIIYLKNLDVI